MFSNLKPGDIAGVRGKDASARSGSVLTAEEIELEGD